MSKKKASKKKAKPSNTVSPSSWDTRSLATLRRDGHTFEAVEKTLSELSERRLFIVARGLVTILSEEVAPHPEILDINEQDIRFVADRLTACLSVIECRLMEANRKSPAK